MYFLDLGSNNPSSTPLLARVSWSHEEYFRALYLRETEKRERETDREREKEGGTELRKKKRQTDRI